MQDVQTKLQDDRNSQGTREENSASPEQAHEPRARQARRRQAQALRGQGAPTEGSQEEHAPQTGTKQGGEAKGGGDAKRGGDAKQGGEAKRGEDAKRGGDAKASAQGPEGSAEQAGLPGGPVLVGRGEGKGGGGVATKLHQGPQGGAAAPSPEVVASSAHETFSGGRGVPYEYGFHKVWAASPLGNGAGDYSKFGEATSGLRLIPVGQAFLSGAGLFKVRDAGLVGVKVLGEGLFLKLAPLAGRFGKFVPIAGGLLSLGAGLYTLSRFNLHDTLAEIKGVFSEEGWQEDPFGRFADMAHLASVWAGLAQASLDTLGGFVDILSGISLLTVAGAGATVVGVQLAEVLKGSALAVEAINSGAFKPMTVLLRFLSALSARVDAAGMNKILKKFETETADALGGIVNTGLNLKGGLPKGLGGVDFNKPVSPDQLNAPGLEKGLPSLWVSQYLGGLGGGEGQIHASLQRWARAQEVMEQERTLFGLQDLERLLDAPLPVFTLNPVFGPLTYIASRKAEPYIQATLFDLAALPEAPCDPLALEHDREVLGGLRQRLARVRGEGLPTLRAYQQGCRDEQARGDELLQAHTHLVGQQELAKGALQERTSAQAEADQKWREVQEKRAGANLDDPRLKEMERQARKILEVIDMVPRDVLPNNIGRAVKAARQALGMGEEVERLKQADAQGRVGGDLLERNRAQIAEGERGVASTERDAQRLEQAGQRHKSEADALAQEVEQALVRGEADEDQIESHIRTLEERALSRQRELEAWAVVHEGRRGRNDKLADSVLKGELSLEKGVAAGSNLSTTCGRALIALHDCLRFLDQVEAQASPEALVHDAWLLDFYKSANVERIIGDGRRDCLESRAALNALAPTDALSLWEERIGEAFDRVGRCRERLRLMPRPQLPQGGGDKTHEQPSPQEQATPCAPTSAPEPPTSAPEPPAAKPDLGPAPRAQVHFKHDAPSPGELGEGSIVQRGNLRQVLAYVAQAPSASVKLVGHASVEGSAQHNHRLAERRAKLVEGLLRTAGAQHIQAEAVGEEVAQGAQGKEYTHEAWRRVDVEVSAP